MCAFVGQQMDSVDEHNLNTAWHRGFVLDSGIGTADLYSYRLWYCAIENDVVR